MTETANSMFDFFLLLLKELPDFLMSEPICYIFGCVIGVFVCLLFTKLLHLAS